MVTRVSLLLIVIVISGCAVLKKETTKGNPPGTVQINDTLFIDRTEVANVHWREYLFYLFDVETGEDNYQKALPDTSVWNKFGQRIDTLRKTDTLIITSSVNNPLTEYYFRHPMFNIYPVVGIRYEQAVEFCKWRTLVVNLGIYMDENNLKNHKEHLNDSFPIKIYYRLPTMEEWEMIAKGNLNEQEFPYGYKDVYYEWKNKQFKMFNCIFPDDKPKIHDPHSPDDQIYTVDCKANFPNSYGTYNMIGNLAEMVSEPGIAKGGSFVDKLDSCKIAIDKYYDGPQAWLGFRCVAVKLK